MKVLMLCAALVPGACATAPEVPGVAPGISFEGGSGASCEDRIRIEGAINADTGVAAERQWLRAKYPSYRIDKQSLIACQDEPTDRVTIVDVAGNQRTVFFDISDFFPKEYVPR